MADHFPHLRPAQRRGLTLWVHGTVLAQSACQSAVVAALLTLGTWHGLRQYLREWLYDGPDRATPCATQLDVTACFAPLLRWVLAPPAEGTAGGAATTLPCRALAGGPSTPPPTATGSWPWW